MELRQLRYFIAVAESLSFSRAAEGLHITVPPLSRQIRQLEDEFNVQLFTRNRRRVVLTDAGRLFLREAKALDEQMMRFTNSVRHARDGDEGTVRIAIGLHLGERLSRAVAEHARRYPLVEIQTTGVFSTMQSAALVEGRVDVGFLRPPIDRVRVKSEPLFEERLVVLMNRANPLSKRRSLRVKDLAGETLLLQDRRVSSGMYDKILELFTRAGISPAIVQLPADSLPNDEVLALLLAADRGIFVVADEIPARMAVGSAAVAVPLEEPDAKVEVHMAWRKNESSGTVLGFIESVRRVFGCAHHGQAPQLALAATGTSC
ncbi:MAG: LysR family transcriptional regulator [Acidobacteriota bacterium]|nr:LysR family transcriptional regulator [Acidobacteriota bacterium]